MIFASPETFADAYTEYRHHEGYGKRARLFVNFPQPIVIVGCGFGYLVKELEQLGVDGWGVDASEYCQINRVTDRFLLWNILDGPLPLKRAGTIITESMLEWLTDDEAKLAAENCARSAGIVIHLVTESGQADYNYHSTGYWMTLTGQITVSLEGM